MRPTLLPLVAALALASPALADCFDGTGKMPRRVTFSGGDVVEIVERAGDRLTYRATGSDGLPSEVVVDSLFFQRRATRGGQTNTFNWPDPLPALADFRPGKSFDVGGRITTSDGIESPTRMRFTILEETKTEVGGCSYPVLRVRVGVEGEDPFWGERLVDPVTLLTLESDMRFKDADGNVRRKAGRAVVIE